MPVTTPLTTGRRAVAVLAALAVVPLVSLPAPAGAAAVGPDLLVDVDGDRHRISEGVYGVSWPSPELARVARLPLQRWGGNAVSRYNHLNRTTNVGSDWYFENIVQETSLEQFVQRARSEGADAAVTVPMTGWVSKDSPSTHPFACGFTVSRYGRQQQVDPWDPDCGNGTSTTGAPLTGNDPADTSVPADAAHVQRMVSHLVRTHGPAARGGVATYQLDNEPSLWHHTHRDVRPRPATYAELASRSVVTAAAVKAADPSASVSGPGDWGWCAYFFSPADGCADGPDRRAHGGVPLTAHLLDAFAAHERRTGTRVLDVLDQHLYPQAGGIAFGPAGDAAHQALRLRQTRVLWDPTYRDESWTSDLGLGPVMLLPRMRQWVADHYPGTGLAIGEYNFGALDSVNGALAQADVLGILGREGVSWAALWGAPAATSPGAFAFRMYRDLDGQGARFGDVSVRARSADQGRLAVYAAQRSGDGAVTLVVVNKTTGDLTSRLQLRGAALGGTAQVFGYSGAAPDRVVRRPDVALSAGTATATFPASSITTVVVPAAAGPEPTPTATPTATPTVTPTASPSPSSSPSPSASPSGPVLATPVLEISARPTTTTAGGSTTIAGRLLVDGRPVVGATVEVLGRPRGGTSWTSHAVRRTDGAGRVSRVSRPVSSWEFSLRAPATPARAQAVSGVQLVEVRPVITLGTSRSVVPAGTPVTFRGRVTPAGAGEAVLERKGLTGWAPVAVVPLSPTGTFARLVTPAVGTASYRVVVAGGQRHAAGTSAARQVTVRPQPRG